MSPKIALAIVRAFDKIHVEHELEHYFAAALTDQLFGRNLSAEELQYVRGFCLKMKKSYELHAKREITKYAKLAAVASAEIKVGDLATLCLGSDQYALIVKGISKTGLTVELNYAEEINGKWCVSERRDLVFARYDVGGWRRMHGSGQIMFGSAKNYRAKEL